MILSRRSFLKVAGLSAVAVAGASMFTGCNANNFFTTPVKYVAGDTEKVTTDAVAALNSNKAATSVLGHSDLHNTHMENEEKYFNKLITDLKYTDVKVEKVEMTKEKDENNKDYWCLKVTLIKKPEEK
ncbi:MAG: twin-arginine translocation signal domain-containing protein [Faecalibacterium sp.]|nr:twin-arginine translocation signal domain-containing protein [Faecalibacterium sp.]